MRKREEHGPPSGVRTADDFRAHLIIDLRDPVFANMRASRVRDARLVACEARSTIRAEVIHLGNWKRFTQQQDRTMSKRDEDIERREAAKKHEAAVEEGAAARRRGIAIAANPYRYDPITYTRSGAADFALRAGWDQGWRSAIWPDPARSNQSEDEPAGSRSKSGSQKQA